MCQHNYNTSNPPDTPKKAARKPANNAPEHPYVHYYDKVHKNAPPDGHKSAQKYAYACLRGYVSGECEGGHRYAKAILCGKEWCRECGRDGSCIHERRIARWWDKLHSLDTVGYLVITVPPEMRQEFRDQKTLSAYRLAIKRYLQRLGYDKGLSRWHWLGDCRVCKGKGCEDCNHTGAGKRYHPHLNILIEAGRIPKAELSGIKDFCTKWCKNNVTGVMPAHRIVAHYQYTDKPEKKTHLLRYVTRPTLRHEHFFKLRKQLHGYRASQSWGKFDIQFNDSDNELVSLETGLCPCCGEKVTWDKFVNSGYWRRQPMEPMEGGYYKLKARPPNPKISKFALINFNSKSLNHRTVNNSFDWNDPNQWN